MDLEQAQKLWQPQPGWLNTASYGLPPDPAWDALQDALAAWRVGRGAWEDWGTATDRCRTAFADLVAVPVADVAVGATVSQLLAPVAAALPTGARVLVPEVEFTSNLFPWLVQAERGVEVRTVALAELAASIDADTDLVAFSLVQSADGTVAAYDEIVAAARAHGALVAVDATQACGWLPFDAARADVVVAGGYKWLMAPRGTAFAYLAPGLRDRLRPDAAGWYAGRDPHASYYGPPLRLADDARRFDLSPAWFSWVGAVPALELLLEIGVEQVRAYDVALANRFLAGLGQPPGHSAIVTVEVPGAQEKLERAGVRAAVRAGRVRASFHLYSTTEDVDLALDALTS
ncbi:aminotransferase class V-fold PLP-dependent enzyme [Verrucosispora sp. WMMA2044]|uniref:Aminotransferase class V-fold PLP-dependent enzyme n=1 Tax=Verrucosispora sioxanthis TaxID=2499994 RepID=A0A6M1KN20_9ACTN|nr:MULTISPECIES: aminotransferase class V-fold PLP-dependent enzyme [Micromonospora]NEE62178.1 aminotransferase class V-fold PLP-dependent enzyme [Verrucosispora sioxanthis]NGM11288.1 aminotransferase class V-fold PLP-dependent enzyme [Verrucosispora sioxanthis]WBB46530.1 aminotransferase class V-fold PLP-dependent enzyme [Verrucosispora sp. WMMA2044]